MSAIKTVTPQEAQQLLESGWLYLDVRSEPEFAAGHVPGAVNVPLLHAIDGGMAPNQEFAAVMEANFGRDERLVVGCKAGGRSARAVQLLAQAGFKNLTDMSAGWDGSRDAFGRAIPGWVRSKLPVETCAGENQTYTEVKKRSPR